MINVEEGQVVAVDVSEPKLGVVGRLLGLVGPDEALRHREHGGDGEDLVGAVVFAGRDQHLGQLRIQRELGHDGAELSQVSVVVQRRQVVEKPENRIIIKKLKTEKNLKRI